MTIHDIKQQLQHSTHPVARVIYIKDHFRVIAITFLKTMILNDHKTPYESKLLVIEGRVRYKESEKEIILNQFDETIIPMNVIHAVTALEDSVCLLIQS